MPTDSTVSPRWPSGLEDGFRRRFELLEQLGAGTFGAVFRARDRSLDRPVVIKVLRLEHAEDPTLVERFRREAEAMARLAHPRVVPLLDHGSSGECHYLIAPDLGGRSLEGELRGALPLAAEEAGEILGAILEGLGALHAAGLVHRDLKPANVLRLEDGTLALIDLGLAGVAGSGGTLTATGQVVGTPGYMAPENIKGAPPGPATDLYAVGVLAYELLTDDNPFRGRDIGETLQNQLTLQPDPPHQVRAEIPPGLSSWVLDLLEKDPADRPTSAQAALQGLRDALQGAGGGAPRRAADAETMAAGAPVPGAAPPPSRPRGPAYLAAALTGLCLVSWWLTRPPVTGAPTPSPAPTRQGPGLPAGLASLAGQELDQALDARDAGEPRLSMDPAAWGENLRHLTVPSRFYAWLASGGRPEDLPEERREALREVDASYRAVGLPAPFGPFLAGASAPETQGERDRWEAPDLFTSPAIDSGPFRGWLAEAHRVALELESRRRRHAAELRRGIEEGDAAAGPRGFLAKWRLMTLAQTAPIPGRVLGALFRVYSGSPSARRAYVEWFGDGHELFRRLGYCLARASRDQPTDADRAALLYSWWTNRFRVFAWGHTAHGPPEFALGFVPDGPAGAALGLGFLREAAGTRHQLHGQEFPPEAAALARRALVLTKESPEARERLGRAAQDGVATFGISGEARRTVGDVEELRRQVERALDLGEELEPRLLREVLSFAVVTYEKILRVTTGRDWEQARADLGDLAPRLLEHAPAQEAAVRGLLARDAPQPFR